jgi:hypothetical protein
MKLVVERNGQPFIPDGIHDVIITDVAKAERPAGTPMLRWTFAVPHGDVTLTAVTGAGLIACPPHDLAHIIVSAALGRRLVPGEEIDMTTLAGRRLQALVQRRVTSDGRVHHDILHAFPAREPSFASAWRRMTLVDVAERLTDDDGIVITWTFQLDNQTFVRHETLADDANGMVPGTKDIVHVLLNQSVDEYRRWGLWDRLLWRSCLGLIYDGENPELEDVKPDEED